MRRLFGSSSSVEADVRPTLLGVVTLMFMLLFFLLDTSSGERLGVVRLGLAAPEALAPLPHSGLVQRVWVQVRGRDIVVEFTVQTTDISASSTSVEQHREVFPARDGKLDIAALNNLLLEIHTMDPAQLRAEVDPDDALPVSLLLRVLDTVRGPDNAPLFPQLLLTGEGA